MTRPAADPPNNRGQLNHCAQSCDGSDFVRPRGLKPAALRCRTIARGHLVATHGHLVARYIAVALVSAALLAFEIVLMRRLLVESWHHFGYLVISVALLGFGASGTLLALVERRVRARPDKALFRLAVALALALLVMPRVASLLPVTARFIPDDLWNQAGWWTLYWLVALTPFLIGAAFLGAALMTAGPHVGRVYAANLFGSAVGAAGAVLLVSGFALEHAYWPSFVLALIAVLLSSNHEEPRASARAAPREEPRASARAVLRPPSRRKITYGHLVVLILTVGGIAVGCHWRLLPAYDEHKAAARLQLLAAQGSVRRVAARADPHGYVELYESDLFHDLPFLALRQSPPPMYCLLINGDPAGSVLRISTAEEAEVMDGTLMALPYRLIRARPRVLLLGETGGANVWLARRQKAAEIDVVQPNAAVIRFLREYSPSLFRGGEKTQRTADFSSRGTARAEARGSSGEALLGSLKAPFLLVHATDPRSFLATHERGQYDLIQIVSLEGLGVGSAGMRSLAEDHLATVEGLAECLRALNDDGVLAVSRGIQQPARENIRIFATLVEALESSGVNDPARHMIQVRDYLGVCTSATKTPLTDERRETLQAAIHAFNLTPVWYDGLPLDEVNRPDEMQGPPGTQVDWLHHAAREILSPRREQFYEAWLMNVRPPHDDNPFFWDFYKPESVAALKQAYGDLWLTRAELGRLFLYASLWLAAGAAIVLILVPLGLVAVRRWITAAKSQGAIVQRAIRAPSVSEWVRMIVYFAGIGLGFMGIEMALISQAIRRLGDSVLASACVIGGILMISGLGSLTAGRVVRGRIWLAPAVVAVAAGILRLVGWGPLSEELAGPWLLLLVALPAAYFMGMPMPLGITMLNERSPRLVPWAWGVNGVAAVVATSAAIVVAMAAGYRTVVILAAGAYVAAALTGAVSENIWRPSGGRGSCRAAARREARPPQATDFF
ncbi:MAG: hypothetical protein KAY37_03530 [Phycisphaerae bacterium]|nr:hypothetical protein [Phycisphaerae bacterium]